MKLNNILVSIQGEDVGSMAIICDLLVNEDEISHPDDPCPSYATSIEVLKIHSVELQIFNKQGVDLTRWFINDKGLKATLCNKIIDQLEYTPIQKLQQAA